MRGQFIMAGLAVAAILGITRIAAADNQNANQTIQKLAPQETVFMRDRAADDVFLWRIGEYAEQHAATEKVKELARTVVQTHREDLQSIHEFNANKQTDVKQPKDLNATQKTMYDRLTAKQGLDFDREYTKLLTAHYSQAIPQYERERDRAQTPSVREYASRQVAKFQDLLRQSKDAQAVVWK